MAEFNDAEEFEKWLEDKPREWAVVLAARSALRVLPLAANYLQRLSMSKRQTALGDFVLPLFRGNALAWSAAVYPDHARRIAASARFAAAAAADSARFAAADFSSKEMWAAVGRDATALEGGSAPAGLAVQPLWLGHEPEWLVGATSRFRDAVLRGGERWTVWLDWYQARLNGKPAWALSENSECAVMLKLANQKNDWWERGSAVVNGDIGEWIAAERRELPKEMEDKEKPHQTVEEFIVAFLSQHGRPARNKQIAAAFEDANYWVKPKTMQWALSNLAKRGKIERLERGLYRATPLDSDQLDNELDEEVELTPGPSAFGYRVENQKVFATPIGRLDTSEFAQDIWADVLEKAKSARERIEKTQAPPRILLTLDRFIAQLGQSVGDVRPGKLLSRSRSLDADLAMLSTPEYREEMPLDAQADLHDLSQSVNDLRALFPALLEHEANRLAREIAEVGPDRVQADLKSSVEEAARSPVVDQTAVEALETPDVDIAEAQTVAAEASLPQVTAEAEIARNRLLAMKALDVRNFAIAVLRGLSKETGRYAADAGGRIRKGSLDGLEEAAKAVPKAGLALLAAHLLGPLAGLAILGSFDRLKKQLESAVGAHEKAAVNDQKIDGDVIEADDAAGSTDAPDIEGGDE